MNGATAVDCATRRSVPSSAIVSRMGASQSFLRARRKVQNSLRNANKSDLLKLVSHGLGRRTGRFALDPISFHTWFEMQPQWISLKEPEQNCRWSDGEKKEHASDQWCGYTADPESDCGPGPIE